MSPGSRVVVVHLTDEEVDVLTDGADDVVLRPYLDTLAEPERRAARRAAERSLAARGWILPERQAPRTRRESTLSVPTVAEVAPPGPAVADQAPSGQTVADAAPSGPTMSVADPLASLLQVRRGAPEVLVIHRWVGETSATRYLFVLAPVIVCEDLSASGVHTLSVAETAERESLVREFLVPPDARACRPGEPSRLLPAGTGATDLVAALGHPVVLAEVVTLRAGDSQGQEPGSVSPDDAVVLALGPAGCYLAERTEPSAWEIRPTTPQGVVDRVAAA